MSSFPSRKLEIWTSSEAKELGSLSGAFCFHLVPSIMVPQTLQYLYEMRDKTVGKGVLINGFIRGMHYYNPKEPGNLFWWKAFEGYSELFEFDVDILTDAIRQLELHTDINLTYSEVSYLADVGSIIGTAPILLLTYSVLCCKFLPCHD